MGRHRHTHAVDEEGIKERSRALQYLHTKTKPKTPRAPACLVDVHEVHHGHAVDEERVEGLGDGGVVARPEGAAAQLVEGHPRHPVPLHGPRDSHRSPLRAARRG